MSDLEEERSLTSTEVAELLVEGMIVGIEKETPPPVRECIINAMKQEQARFRKHKKELEEQDMRGEEHESVI